MSAKRKFRAAHNGFRLGSPVAILLGYRAATRRFRLAKPSAAEQGQDLSGHRRGPPPSVVNFYHFERLKSMRGQTAKPKRTAEPQRGEERNAEIGILANEPNFRDGENKLSAPLSRREGRRERRDWGFCRTNPIPWISLRESGDGGHDENPVLSKEFQGFAWKALYSRRVRENVFDSPYVVQRRGNSGCDWLHPLLSGVRL